MPFMNRRKGFNLREAVGNCLYTLCVCFCFIQFTKGMCNSLELVFDEMVGADGRNLDVNIHIPAKFWSFYNSGIRLICKKACDRLLPSS